VAAREDRQRYYGYSKERARINADVKLQPLRIHAACKSWPILTNVRNLVVTFHTQRECKEAHITIARILQYAPPHLHSLVFETLTPTRDGVDGEHRNVRLCLPAGAATSLHTVRLILPQWMTPEFDNAPMLTTLSNLDIATSGCPLLPPYLRSLTLRGHADYVSSLRPLLADRLWGMPDITELNITGTIVDPTAVAVLPSITALPSLRTFGFTARRVVHDLSKLSRLTHINCTFDEAAAVGGDGVMTFCNFTAIQTLCLQLGDYHHRRNNIPLQLPAITTFSSPLRSLTLIGTSCNEPLQELSAFSRTLTYLSITERGGCRVHSKTPTANVWPCMHVLQSFHWHSTECFCNNAKDQPRHYQLVMLGIDAHCLDSLVAVQCFNVKLVALSSQQLRSHIVSFIKTLK